MENHIKVNVSLNGQTLGGINYLKLSQRYDWHHTFEIDVPVEVFGGTDKFQTAKANISKPVTIEFKALQTSDAGSPDNDSDGQSVTQANYRPGSLQFSGLVTSMSLSRSNGIEASILIKGYSKTILLEDGLSSKAYNEKAVSGIFNQVLGNYSGSLNANVKPTPDTQLGYCMQYNETNYNFINRLAANYGQWCFYDGAQLVIGKLPPPKQTYTLTFGIDLEDYQFDLKLAPINFTAMTYDYTSNMQIQVASGSVKTGSIESDADVKALLPLAQSFYKNSQIYRPREFVKTQSDLQAVMQYKKAGITGDLVILSGRSNDFRLTVGSRIKINTNSNDKNSAVDDEFTVIKVQHFAGMNGKYHNSFEAVPKEIDFPPGHSSYVNPVCETQPAKVVKNNDKDSMGRIKVQFYWQASGEATPWIRMLSPYTGKQKGIQFIPEVGDEVLVAFENNNPSFPYVLGSLHHANAKQDDRQDSDNYVKNIRTVSGNEIRFYDKSGSEEISIHDKNSQNEVTLTLANNGQITIKSQNKIAISGKDITVDAQNSIKMTADTIEISGKSSVKVESQQKCTVSVMDFELDANNSIKMAASATAELQAQAGVTIDGGPTTSIKSSGMMDINGGGQATIKAGIVMIN